MELGMKIFLGVLLIAIIFFGKDNIFHDKGGKGGSGSNNSSNSSPSGS